MGGGTGPRDAVRRERRFNENSGRLSAAAFRHKSLHVHSARERGIQSVGTAGRISQRHVSISARRHPKSS